MLVFVICSEDTIAPALFLSDICVTVMGGEVAVAAAAARAATGPRLWLGVACVRAKNQFRNPRARSDLWIV